MANVTKDQKNGVWSISCSQHGFLEDMKSFDSPKYRIPTAIGSDMTRALLRFMQGRKRKFIDSSTWPNNPGCSALTQPTPTTQSKTQTTSTQAKAQATTQPKGERHSLKAES